MNSMLYEATIDDILVELNKRFPCGMVLLGLRPQEGSPEEAEKMERTPFLAWNGSYESLGLMALARSRILKNLNDSLICKERTVDPDEDEE